MRVAVLTSSRADYSQYVPLLTLLSRDSFFDVSIIAFGTHLSKEFGETIHQITQDGFAVNHRIQTHIAGDSPHAMVESISKTILGFSQLWEKEKFDLVIVLGDRFEMFAACVSTLPYNLRIAHLHGGEQTEGALDDIFRHSITHMANLHFTSTDVYKQRVIELTGSERGVYNVGALSIDNLKKLTLLSIDEFKAQFKIDLSKPSVLITFHPETKSIESNSAYCDELIAALATLQAYQLIITMPNADIMGSMIRNKMQTFIKQSTNAIGVESFGTIGYLSCMKHAAFMLGNTSSGFLEASFFPKTVINIGNRQRGRIVTPNIINCDIQRDSILAAIAQVESKAKTPEITIYGDGNTASKIIKILKNPPSPSSASK